MMNINRIWEIVGIFWGAPGWILVTGDDNQLKEVMVSETSEYMP